MMESNEPIKKRVYLATDDPTGLKEARVKYLEPEWEIYGNSSVASAGIPERRYEDGLFGIVRDVIFLSKTDFLVCTFSSNVGK